MSDLGWSLKLVNEEKQDVGEHYFIPDMAKGHCVIEYPERLGGSPEDIVVRTTHWVLYCSSSYSSVGIEYLQLRKDGVPFANVSLRSMGQVGVGAFISGGGGSGNSFHQELTYFIAKNKDLAGFNHSPAYNANGGCTDCGMPRGEGHWTYCKRHEVY